MVEIRPQIVRRNRNSYPPISSSRAWLRCGYSSKRASNTAAFRLPKRSFLGIDLGPQQTVLANMLPHVREDHRREAEQRERFCAARGERFRATGVFQPR